MGYPNRDKMVNDLIKNYHLKGMNYNQIIDLLGNKKMQEDKIYYEIIVDYGRDIDPVYTKTLEISFTKDSIVNDAKIVEWEK